MGYRRTYRIHESGESKTDPDLNSNPIPKTNPNPKGPNGHRRPYRIHESGESKTDPYLNSNPISKLGMLNGNWKTGSRI